MPTRNIVVTGSSSGGIEALSELVAGFPADLPAAVFVVQHVAAHSIDFLPKILGQRSSLPVQLAKGSDAIRPGTVYVVPSNRHLLVGTEQMMLSHSPRENRARPAVDPLFRSAALAHGSSVVGVILSGWLDDGAAGLRAGRGNAARFRCHTGHAFSGRHLMAGLHEAQEQALWVALRTMEERARMLRRLGQDETRNGRGFSTADFCERADEVESHIGQLRGLLESI